MAHQKLVDFLAHQCSCELWRCWYEITEPQVTVPSLLSTKAKLLVSGTMLLICMSSYSLNMSFTESIIWGSPNCSGMGLYRVDRTPSILRYFFFVGASLLGGFTCCTSTSCASQGLIPAVLCGTCHVCGRLVLDKAGGTLLKPSFLYCSRRYTSPIA